MKLKEFLMEVLPVIIFTLLIFLVLLLVFFSLTEGSDLMMFSIAIVGMTSSIFFLLVSIYLGVKIGWNTLAKAYPWRFGYPSDMVRIQLHFLPTSISGVHLLGGLLMFYNTQPNSLLRFLLFFLIWLVDFIFLIQTYYSVKKYGWNSLITPVPFFKKRESS